MRAVCTVALVGVSLLAGAARADEPLPPLSTSGPDVTPQGPVTPVVTGPKPPPPAPPPAEDAALPLQTLHRLVRDDARLARTQRYVGGGLALGVGALFVGAGALLFADGHSRTTSSSGIERAIGLGLIGGGAVTFITGSVALLLPSRMENLDDRLTEIEADPSAAPTQKLSAAEAALARAAQADRFDRTLGGVVLLVASAASAMAAGGFAGDGNLSGTQRGSLAVAFGIGSTVLAARGIWSFVAERGHAERLLQTWRTGTGRDAARLELAPTVVLLPGAMGAGVAGRF